MDSKESTVDRRSVLRRVGGGLALLVLAPVAAAVQGCKKELACTDTAGLTYAETQTRGALRYVDHSTDPAKQCKNCRLFQPAGPESCGHCQVLKGPINPLGGCLSWVIKA
jgi:High potential iron-sulfur protein